MRSNLISGVLGVLFGVAAIGCGARSSLHEGLRGAGGGGTTTSAIVTASSASGSTGSGCSDEIVAMDPAGANAIAVDGNTVVWGTLS